MNSKLYGVARISTGKQNIERQIRNILAKYPDATIVKETYTGTKLEGRKEFENLLKISKQNYNDGKTDLTSVIVMEQSYCEIVVSYLNALTDYYTDWIDFLREVNSEDFSIEAEDI